MASRRARTSPPFLGADGRNSKPVESTAPSRISVEGGSGSSTPGAPTARGVRSAARGLKAAGCRDLKWCPCPGVGAGELCQAGEEPAPRLGRRSASGPRQDSGSRPGPPRAFRPFPSRESLRSPREKEAARGGEGRGGGRSWDGPRLESCESGRDCPLPSALFPRLPYSGVVLGREVLRGSSPRAWSGRGPSFP